MKRTRLTTDQFDHFVDTISSHHIDPQRYGDTDIRRAASWARWSGTAFNVVPTDNWLKTQDLTTSVMLVASNLGGSAADIQKFIAQPPWATFHNDPAKNCVKPDKGITKKTSCLKPHQRLQRVFQNLLPADFPAHGAYMTDAFKLMPTANVQHRDFLALISAPKAQLAPHAESFAVELGAAMKANGNQPPLILAIGRAAHETLVGRGTPTPIFADIIHDVTRVSARQLVRYVRHYSTRDGNLDAVAQSFVDAIRRHDTGAAPDL